MRIWAFPSFYPFDRPNYRWHGIFAHRQYKGLQQRGADIKVIQPVMWSPPFPFSQLHPQWATLSKIDYPDRRYYDGIEVFHPRISNIKPNRLVRKSYNRRYIDAIVTFFRDNNIQLDPRQDIFFSQWLLDSARVQAAAHELGVKSAVLAIGDDMVVWPRQSESTGAIFRETWENADVRFTCADYLGREADSIMGHHLDYTVTNWGVDYNAFKPADPLEKKAIREKFGWPTDKIIILNVGSLIVRKGWIDLLDALEQADIQKDAVRLLAVYAGSVEIDIRAEAEKRGLGGCLIDQGEVIPENVPEMFQAADIFCLPSHWEGLANANIEAMSSGLPVITTNVCGHPELITHGENGILIPPKRPDVLRSELEKLVADKELRTRLGTNARQHIVEKWGNFSDNAAKLIETLQHCLGQ